MAKKIYLYDSHGYDFYACEFEGLDANGNPRLTIVTPGRPVENLLDHLDIGGEDPGDYLLLCEEGKPADSKFVIEMLGQILLNVPHPYERMSQRLDEMRKNGITYDREQQLVEFSIYEHNNEASKSKKYHLMMYVGDNRYVSESDDFDSIKDIMITLSGFYIYVEQQFQIPIKKRLEVQNHLKKLVTSKYADLFDEIRTI